MNISQKSRLFPEILLIAIIFNVVLTLSGLWGKGLWPLDLTSHFPLQYLGSGLFLLILLFIFRPSKTLAYALVLALCMLINLTQVGSYYWPMPLPKTTPMASVKVLHMNVLYLNRNYQAVHALVQSTDADILSLQEVNGKWLASLQKQNTLNAFPYQIIHRDAKNILASRRPFKNTRMIQVSPSPKDKQESILMAEMMLGNRAVTIINLHPPVPLSPKSQGLYDRYFQKLTRYEATMRPDRILIGDLNTTPWSGNYGQYLSRLKLRDARAHQGFYPTWNTFLPMSYIPIDHVLISQRFVPLQQRTGAFVGSDHLPVYMELGFRP